MLYKLIFKNVRKNLSDYLIYFITIMIAVSLFYAFNSIGTQKAFVHLSLTKGFGQTAWNFYFIAIIYNCCSLGVFYYICKPISAEKKKKRAWNL